MPPRVNIGLHRYAIFTACCTFFLLIAGGLVTSNDAGLAVPDWPLSYGSLTPPMVGGILYEHGHRMVATTVGLLTIGLAVWIARREQRAWVRRLGWIALGAVIAQGLLGGLTVKLMLPKPVSVAHASLAQTFFCIVAGLALFTGPWWQSDLAACEDSGSPRLRTLTVLTVASTFVQLILGAAYRHRWITVVPHMLGAALVLILTTWTTRTVRKRHAGIAELRSSGALLQVLVGLQILLGIGAYWSLLITRNAPQPMPMMVWTTVAHLALGALTLAAAVLLALRAFRVVVPAGDVRLSTRARSAAA